MAVPDQETSQPAPLSFPATHYAKLAPSAFLAASLSLTPPVRPNGRRLSESRPVSVNTGSLANANGSAVIRLGRTSVVCGVRAELLPVANIHGGLPPTLQEWQDTGARPRLGQEQQEQQQQQGYKADADVIAELNLLVPNLELSTGCNPAHLPGNAPGTMAQSLTQRILMLLRVANLVRLEDLIVWHERTLAEGLASQEVTENPNDPERMAPADVDGDGASGRDIKAFWTLYIDILYISLDGSAFEGAWLSVLAALRDVVLPKAWWDEDREVLLCSPMRNVASKLQLKCMPVVLSASVFTSTDASGREHVWLLQDADDFEESVAESQLTVVVVVVVVTTDMVKKSRKPYSQRLLRLEATGKLAVPSNEVRQLLDMAPERCKEWQAALNWEQ